MKNIVIKRVKDGTLKVKLRIFDIIFYVENESDIEMTVNNIIEDLKIRAREIGCLETIKLISFWYSSK